MRGALIGLLVLLASSPVQAQLAPANENGVTFSHVHLSVTDVGELWQVVERVVEQELGEAVNTKPMRDMAASGATVLAWLAGQSEALEKDEDPVLPTPATVEGCFQRAAPRAVPTAWNCDPPTDCEFIWAVDRWIRVAATLAVDLLRAGNATALDEEGAEE